MRITVVYFVNVTCTYSSILVKWVSFISGYTNISILVYTIFSIQVRTDLHICPHPNMA